jgi:isopenicillin N synthase-like dioxygenase
LPDHVKATYEDKDSLYNFGWSCGKETLENGLPDVNKGSYYANPLIDEPAQGSKELEKQYYAYCRPNIWPRQHLPELEAAFKALGRLMIEVGTLLARRCDDYAVAKLGTENARRLETIIKESPCPKGRLLHYFPPPLSAVAENNNDDDDGQEETSGSWCGWHTDHGSLTALTSALFLNSQLEEEKVHFSTATTTNSNTKQGLHIRARDGTIVRAVIPPDHLAFQIGEAAQVLSGGALVATPHCVVAPKIKTNSRNSSRNMSRNTFAVFMQPKWDLVMNLPDGSGDLNQAGIEIDQQEEAEEKKKTMNFGEFTEKRLSNYYDTKKG